MNMPAFTAEASLYKTARRYRTARHTRLSAHAIHASAIIDTGEEEVIEVEGEAPLGLPWGWPGGWTIPWPRPRGGSGGSGSGGSGGRSDLTNCTERQLNSEDAVKCGKKQQEDLNKGITNPHYVRCVGEHMGCCRDYFYKGKKYRACVPLKDTAP